MLFTIRTSTSKAGHLVVALCCVVSIVDGPLCIKQVKFGVLAGIIGFAIFLAFVTILICYCCAGCALYKRRNMLNDGTAVTMVSTQEYGGRENRRGMMRNDRVIYVQQPLPPAAGVHRPPQLNADLPPPYAITVDNSMPPLYQPPPYPASGDSLYGQPSLPYQGPHIGFQIPTEGSAPPNNSDAYPPTYENNRY